jgi:hypothetical protein
MDVLSTPLNGERGKSSEEMPVCRCFFYGLYFGRIGLYVGLLLRWLWI